MVLIVAGIMCVFATTPQPTGSCATANGNRCGGVAKEGCGCDINCLTRKDCCADYSTLCVGACPANNNDMFVCRDGTECDPLAHPAAYGCCGAHGGKLKCPSSLPYMCTGINGGYAPLNPKILCGDDHCCFSTPTMCIHPAVDRSLLQDCPTLQSGKPSICPYNHGPQQLLPNVTNMIGSLYHRFSAIKEAASMETRMDGKFAPGILEWHFCPPHNEATKMLCKNGKQCDVRTDGWGCCAETGRLRCPAEYPVMCAQKTCGGDDYCCATSRGSCGAPLKECPVPDVIINSTVTGAVRQCSANAPVLCNDNVCAWAKSDCGDKIQTACPEVPTCKGTGEWEATPVGGTAYAPCDKDVNGTLREGRKYRACVSKFEAGKEIAAWDLIMDGDHICRPAQPKCASTVLPNGDRVPYLPVGTFHSIPKTDCPQGKEGVNIYHCILCPATNDTKHEITPLCDLPCTRDGYCSGNGEATSASHDVSLVLGDSCYCNCDSPWTGKHCDKNTRTASGGEARSKISSMQWMVLVVLGMLSVASFPLACALKRRLVPVGSCDSPQGADVEDQMNAHEEHTQGKARE